MPSKTVVLHFGAHKTGTSLIQKFMRDKEGFCDHAKILALPRSQSDEMIGWGRPDDLEAGAAQLQAALAAFEVDGNTHFLISHENALGRPFQKNSAHLYPNAERNFSDLKAAMAGRDCRIIYYIRSQAAFIESYYLQTIHEGAFHPFRAWLDGLGTHGFSWKPVIAAARQSFGAENVMIKSFDAEMANGQTEFLRNFFESFTTTADDYHYRAYRNPSIGDRGLHLALQINAHLKPRGGERKIFRKLFQDHFSNRDYPRPVLFSEAEKAALNERFGAEYAEILGTAA